VRVAEPARAGAATAGTPAPTTPAPSRRRRRPGEPLSAAEARWLAIAAQGLDAPRPQRRAGRAQLVRLMERLGAIQLDAVNVLERTQYLVPFSRLGPYDRELLHSLSAARQPWFEYWGHAASLMPVATYPLFRHRMARFVSDGPHASLYERRRHAWARANAAYLDAVLAEVTARGPLAASELSDPRRQVGEWWDRRSLGRQSLELLFGQGILAGWRTASFERVYDLADRVIAAAVRAAPVPDPEAAERDLLARAAGALGVATVTDLAAYFAAKVPPVRRRVSELVEAGRLQTVTVEGWRDRAYVAADPTPRPPRRTSATLLSPFDSLIWTRERAERLFGFRYRIEIYVKGPERTHGYYVLPLLLGDRLVGRFDLKAERKRGVLAVQAAHHERGVAAAEVAGPAADELRALADWLGCPRVTVVRRGELAPALRAALGR
jgi:uncharacterized protein